MPDPTDSARAPEQAPSSDSTLWQWAAIIDSSRDAIVASDHQGKVTRWNAGAQALFGYSAQDIIGQPLRRLVPARAQAEAEALMAGILRGEAVEPFETVLQTLDDRLIDVSVALSPIRDDAGRIVGVAEIARDITAARQASREVARLQRLYDALSHVNQAIVWSTNRDELFHRVCRVLVEHGGLAMAWIGEQEPGTHRLLPVAEFGDHHGYLQALTLYTDERPEGRGPSGSAFRTGNPHVWNDLLEDSATFPWRPQLLRSGYRASSGFAIRQHGQVCGVLSLYADRSGFFRDKEVALLAEAATDISFALDNFAREAARQQAEQQLRHEKLFSDAMLESMPGVVYFYDDSGRFLRWNRNFEVVSGYSGNEIAAMHPLDFFTAADHGRLQEAITRVFAEGEAAVEADFVGRDGRGTPYFFTGRRVEFQHRICLVGVGIDIAERQRATLALHQLNTQLEQKVAERTDDLRAALVRAEAADQLKSAFLATMSHELRTPLNSIIGFTGIVLRGLAGPLNDEQGKQLGMVRSSARHLLALVNDVLDISKIEAGQLVVARHGFDLRRSIDKVIGQLSPQVQEKGLALRLQLAPALGEAIGDERRFEQILLNLLSNALKFTDRGEVGLQAELCADEAGAAATVRVRVSDSGIGIRPEDLPHLFRPFRQIDSGLSRNHEGTGLGLAICQRLAQLMGGKIEVRSEWGRGSSFTVELPLCTPLQASGEP